MNFHHDFAVRDEPIPAVPVGLPALAKLAFSGNDLSPIWNDLVTGLSTGADEAASLMDLSTIAHLQGRRDDRLALQREALRLNRLYRRQPDCLTRKPIRLLAFMAPGDFFSNLPIEFLLEGTAVRLDMVYILPGSPLPDVPDHDVALVAVAESEENKAILRDTGELVRAWPRPVLNVPDRIARLTRDGTWDLLKSTPGVVIPVNVRASRDELCKIACSGVPLGDVFPIADFPIIVRPLDSHAGHGLSKLDDRSSIAGYLETRPEAQFYIAPFVDYRSADGLFRKYRVVLLGGRPYASHMAISKEWMIHYLNAGMTDSAWKRAEEADFMARFDEGFALRHKHALHAVWERIGLDYIPFDCGETPEGKLLIFESGTNMIVHSMDPPDLFPYKRPQMEKIFQGFEAMLRSACAQGSLL
jgi:hypothetical protein